jgi:hypothetical protein
MAEKDSATTIPSLSTVAADVNSRVHVPLYTTDGLEILVEEANVAMWLTRGFTRKPIDLDGLLAEAEALSAALMAPWRAYVDSYRASGGQVDAAAQTTAHAAVALLSDALNRLHLGMHANVAAAVDEA